MENTAIKNHLDENMTTSNMPPHNPLPSKTGTILDPFVLFFQFIPQIIFIHSLNSHSDAAKKRNVLFKTIVKKMF